MKIKRIIAVLLSLVIALSISIAACAEENTETFTDPFSSSGPSEEAATDAPTSGESYTASNGYSYNYMIPYLDKNLMKYDDVYDFAELLTDEEEAELSKVAEDQGSKYGISVVFLTYDDSFGKSTRTFTDDFFDYFYGIYTSGVLLAVDMDNRDVYINTMGTAITHIDDDEIDSILDSTYTYASDSDYYGFFVNTLDKTLYAYDDNMGTYAPYDYGGEYGTINSEPNPFVPTGASLIATVVITALVLVVAFAVHSKNNRAPSAENYMGGNLNVISRNEIFRGVRQEVMHDYYKQSSSSGGGGSFHSSGGGGSHGGGGHGF